MSNDVLAYEGRPQRTSPWAIGIFCGSIVAAVAFFFVIPAVVMLVAALIVRGYLRRNPELGGYGYATAAMAISGSAVGLGLWVLVLLPSGCRSSEMAHRGTCSANLRAITQSLAVYAASEADAYPVVRYAPYVPAMNVVSGIASSKDPAKVQASYYKNPPAQAGSVQASLWILVANGSVSPKQFVCKSDPFSTSAAQASDPSGTFYDNFQSPDQLSYSFAYPWCADGQVGKWWKSNTDASLPLGADMNPQQSTGTPARTMTPASAPSDNKTWNSSNHQGDGQNVAFGDNHVEFTARPTVGQDQDNIYTLSASPSTGPRQFGGLPAGKTAPRLTKDEAPFDTVLLPVRNETTGKF